MRDSPLPARFIEEIMNTTAVAAFIRSKYKDLSDGITLYEVDGSILFEIRNARGESVGNYMIYFVKPPLKNEVFDPNVTYVSEESKKNWFRYPVRIPDHSELGATKTGWQLRVKNMLDKQLEDFREAIRKHESGEQLIQDSSTGSIARKNEAGGAQRGSNLL